MRRLSSLLLALTLGAAGLVTHVSSAAPPDCDAPGASRATATKVGTPLACHGSLTDTTQPEQWYAFTVDAGETIGVTLQQLPSSGLQLRLWNGTTDTTTANCVSAQPNTCAVQNAAAGTWSVGIIYTSGGAGDYALGIDVVPTQNGQCEPVGGDAPNSASGSTDAGRACTGATGTATDPSDFFRLTVPAPQNATDQSTIVAGMTTLTGGRLALGLIDPAGVVRTDCTNSNTSICVVPNAASGDWYVSVKPLTNAGGQYLLTTDVLTVGSLQRTCEPSKDAADSAATATAAPTVVPGLVACVGEIASADAADWYSFDVTASAATPANIVTAVAPLGGGQMRIHPRDPQGGAVEDRCATEIASACAIVQTTAGGTWKAGVTPDGATSGLYALVIWVLPGASTTVGAGGPPCETTDASNDRGRPSSLPRAVAASDNAAACSGTFGPGDPADWYALNVHAALAAIQIAVQPSDTNGDVTLIVIAPDGTTTTSQTGRRGQPEVFESHDSARSAKGVWRVGIVPVPGSTTTGYALIAGVEGL